MQIMVSGRRFIIMLFFITVYIICSTRASASENSLSPPIEFGGGIGYIVAENYPVWSNENYRMGSITGAVRLYRGLSLQGGLDGSFRENIDMDTLEYGDELRLDKINKTYFVASWIGLRYEFPIGFIKRDYFSIHTMYASLGISWAQFDITSTEWSVNGVSEPNPPETNYQIARVRGPYAMLAARWRFDTAASKETGSWFGAYGLDAGLKYTRYNTCIPKYDTIEEADSSFSTLQVFIVGFVKIRFFK